MKVTIKNGSNYYIDKTLKGVWDKIRNGQLQKIDEDRVYVVDGKERTGKSVFAIQQAAYLDENFDVNNIVFTPDEFIAAIKNAKKGQAIVYDEAFFGLSSRSAIGKVNKQIVRCLMEVGQKNLIIFLVMPSFFELDKYAAIHRAEVLFHVHRDTKGKRGIVRVYNKGLLQKLYAIGKKHHSYDFPKSFFSLRFFNQYPIDEEKYREKKSNSLWEEKKTPAQDTNEQMKNFIRWIMNHYISMEKIGEIDGVSPQAIHKSVQKVSKILGKPQKSTNQPPHTINFEWFVRNYSDLIKGERT
jgi:hypothetical protein